MMNKIRIVVGFAAGLTALEAMANEPTEQSYETAKASLTALCEGGFEEYIALFNESEATAAFVERLEPIFIEANSTCVESNGLVEVVNVRSGPVTHLEDSSGRIYNFSLLLGNGHNANYITTVVPQGDGDNEDEWALLRNGRIVFTVL